MRASNTPGCILIQPAALARGLGACLPENVRLFEESPVVEIDYGAEITLICPAGSVRTKTLLLATNGFTTQLGFEHNRLIPIMTFGSLTRPLTEAEQAALGGEHDWGVIPADHLGTTLRYTQDNRLLVRNCLTYAPDYICGAEALGEIYAHHVAAVEARFPMLPEVTFEHTWDGVLAFSRNLAPRFGQLSDNVFAAVCHNGVGYRQGDLFGHAPGRSGDRRAFRAPPGHARLSAPGGEHPAAVPRLGRARAHRQGAAPRRARAVRGLTWHGQSGAGSWRGSPIYAKRTRTTQMGPSCGNLSLPN